MIWLRLTLAAGVLLALLAGFRAGVHGLIDMGVQQERARNKEAVNEQFREASRFGGQLAATARDEAQAARDYATRLSMERSHAGTALVNPVSCEPGDAAGVHAAAGLAADGAQEAAQPAGGQAQLHAGPPPGRELHLTADAVRLWNSALAGADVPAGACGADGGPAGACAADTEFTLDDAWGNQAENAVRCSVDRIRLRRLVEFLKGQGALNQPKMEQR